ncbi:putative cyclic nucleotide-gated ion channel 10, variant 2 [Trifolium repens]|nr:putative cyclic nucleotide-gated ion channel 10, variant 2 [Trifolium repens]
MSPKEKKFVRFEDWKSESSSFNFSQYDSSIDGFEKRKSKSSVTLTPTKNNESLNKQAPRCSVLDPQAMRYLSSHFIIDILSILPLPQMVILAMIPIPQCSVPYIAKDWLKYTIITQYAPRLLRIYPLFKEVTSTSGILTETAWVGAAYNLFLYMLASHVVGAFWYLFSIESELRCWRRRLKNTAFFDDSYLSCGRVNSTLFSILNNSTTCPYRDPDAIIDPTVFNFGIFIDALTSRVVELNTSFHHKFFYCFWWGLRNLSSVGQNLKTSTYIGEIIFAIFIAVFGLVLFALLIGNMQKYLQSTTVRVEEMRIKRRDAEQWMCHRMLPEYLKERIRRYEQYKWQENRGVEEENLIRNLPKDLRRDIKRHLCLDLLKKVPIFGSMDEKLLDAMCDKLKPVLYTEKSCVVREENNFNTLSGSIRCNGGHGERGSYK